MLPTDDNRAAETSDAVINGEVPAEGRAAEALTSPSPSIDLWLRRVDMAGHRY